MATAVETQPESAFLDAEATLARRKLRTSLGALPRNLEHAISPRAWTSRFPWLAVGATVLGVFGLAVALQNRLARRAAARSTAEICAGEPRLGAARYAPRRSSHKAARLARGFLRRMVVGPLRAALMAQLRGMF